MGRQLPGVVKLLPGRELLPLGEQALENAQVPVGVAGAGFPMGNSRAVPSDHIPYRGHRLVDSPPEGQPGKPPDEPLPVVGEHGPAPFVKGGVIGQHHHIGLGGKRLFQL